MIECGEAREEIGSDKGREEIKEKRGRGKLLSMEDKKGRRTNMY